jgi:hypothetical protein
MAATAQEKKPQLYFIEDYVVKPSMIPQFEAALKEFTTGFFQPYAWPWPFEAYATDDFHYYFLYPAENMAGIDKMFANFYEMLGKFGEEKYDSLNRKLGDATEYFKQGTITLSPELSYIPEKPRLKPEEVKFVYWGFCYVLPGKEKDFEEQFKKIVALFKTKKISSGFNSWIGGIGTEMPFYFYSETGKSPADFFLTSEKVMKLVDPDVTNIWNAVLGLMRKYEFKMGLVRPDLSYTPAAKAK